MRVIEDIRWYSLGDLVQLDYFKYVHLDFMLVDNFLFFLQNFTVIYRNSLSSPRNREIFSDSEIPIFFDCDYFLSYIRHSWNECWPVENRNLNRNHKLLKKVGKKIKKKSK